MNLASFGITSCWIGVCTVKERGENSGSLNHLRREKEEIIMSQEARNWDTAHRTVGSIYPYINFLNRLAGTNCMYF